MSQNLPNRSPRDFLSLRHPNHFVLADANNRNVIITYQLLVTLFEQIDRDFFWHTDCWLYISTVKYLPYYARELLECLLGSLVPRRFRLGHSWTLPWAVTSPRDTRGEGRERVLSPSLSQTSRGERIKREGLGTRLPPRNFAFWAKSLRGQQFYEVHFRRK